MEDIRTMLNRVASGELSVDQAVLELKKEPFSEAGFDELGFAKLDTHRRLRQGIAEVIYGAGKTAEQIAGIVEAMKKRGQELVLITRMDPEKARHTEELLKQKFEDGAGFRYFDGTGIGICGDFPEKDGVGTVVVATGGTSDIPVAEEAALTAEALGNQVERLYDVGVAGLHRLVAHHERPGDHRHRWNGGSSGQRHWRPGGLPGHCSSHQHWLRRLISRRLSPAFHAEFLRQRGQRGKYRQWIRGRISGQYDQSYEGIEEETE